MNNETEDLSYVIVSHRVKNHEWEILNKYMKRCLKCTSIVWLITDEDGIHISQPPIDEDCNTELVKRVLTE